MPTHTKHPVRKGSALCNKLVPAGVPVTTLHVDGPLGSWPDEKFAANPKRPTCPRCHRTLYS